MKYFLSLVISVSFLLSPLLTPAMAAEGSCPAPAETEQGRHKASKRCEMAREVQEFKLKFLAQEMELRDDQQKRFFDLYNAMSEEKFKVFTEVRRLESQIKNNPNATEAEYAAVSEAITKAKARDAEIEKKYDDQFSTFLTKKQIFKMKAAEDKFRRKMHEMNKQTRKRKK